MALAKAVAYDFAGTVEFVAGQDKSFYFLEMNTRLKVEQPVDEVITGVDLVEQMTRVAAAKSCQSPEGCHAHRLGGRSRVYAEDPFRDFLPRSGGW